MAESHPVGFQWVMEAKRRGAKIIHVDPRFTRTSAVADLHVPIRVGSDIVFLGAIVNYILQNGRDFRDYVVHYTNAAAILSDDYRDTEDLEGLFSGWDAEKGAYSELLGLQGHGAPLHRRRARAGGRAVPRSPRRRSAGRQPAARRPHTRASPLRLPDPQAPLQPLHARDGRAHLRNPRGAVPRGGRDAVRQLGARAHVGLCYAVGWTQHTVAVQYIRTAAIMQLLLGNIGRPGGGIMAMRGHASIQGSTDIPTLYNILPGYLPMPHPHKNAGVDSYVERNDPRAVSGATRASNRVRCSKRGTATPPTRKRLLLRPPAAHRR